MKRAINYLRTHTSLYVPGVGETGNVLPRPSKRDAISMSASTEGAIVTLNGKQFIVPWGNVQLAVLEPESLTVKANSISTAA